jgi:hypothetical protein
MRRGWTIHHNGPPANCVGHPHSRCEAFWRAVRSFHMNDLGWSDIAYSFGVCHHGERFVGRGWDKRQFANGSDTVGANDGNDSEWYTVLVFVGGDTTTHDTEPPTASMVRSTAELIDEGRRTGRCGDRVTPHNFWKRKPCPGPEFTALAASWDRRPSPLLTPPPPAPEDDMPYSEADLKRIVGEVLDDRLTDAGTDTRQGVFDLSRAASILGGYLAVREDFATGEEVYWITPGAALEFPQGSPLHNWFKADLENRGQSTGARPVPGPVLDQLRAAGVITRAYPPGPTE